MNPQIPLVSDLLPLVLSGKKTSTVRVGRRNYKLGPATIVSGDANVTVLITEVQHTTVRQLSDQVARKEGYVSKSELLAALLRFYPDLEDDREVTVVSFERT